MSTTSRTEIEEYDRRWAGEKGHYSAEAIGYTPHFLRFMNRWVSRSTTPRPTVLEVGCGDGFFSSKFIAAGCQVTGIDLSSVGIETARRQNPAGTFVQHDLSQPLPWDANTFDFVWCSEVLEHLFSPLAVLEEIHRVLRPGGILLATVPYHGMIKNLLIALFAFERHYDPTYPHLRFFTKKSLSDLVRRAGLEILEIGHCGSGLGVRDVISPTNILLAAQRPEQR